MEESFLSTVSSVINFLIVLKNKGVIRINSVDMYHIFEAAREGYYSLIIYKNDYEFNFIFPKKESVTKGDYGYEQNILITDAELVSHDKYSLYFEEITDLLKEINDRLK